MEELVTNLHMHTVYSDGTGLHQTIANAALKAGLDVVIVTDHNVFVEGVEGYFDGQNRRVLMLIGQEIHDQARDPQKNHMLVIGAGRDLATFAHNPQTLIDQVKQAGGLSFLAHPFETAMPAFGETDISWVDWDIHAFTGLELWNGLSELKSVAHSTLQAYFMAFFPQFIAHGPLPETLAKWDELTTSGSHIVAVGGSDAHELKMHAGPIHRDIFPYEFHFRCINNHLLVDEPLTGDLEHDRQMVINSLREGHTYIGYDLPASTKGFRFSAQGMEQNAIMGDSIRVIHSITLQIKLPFVAECRLLRDGIPVQIWRDRQVCSLITSEPGVYRVEVYLPYLGKNRGWIFSNPIYVLPEK
jgi:hypothetical protein